MLLKLKGYDAVHYASLKASTLFRLCWVFNLVKILLKFTSIPSTQEKPGDEFTDLFFNTAVNGIGLKVSPSLNPHASDTHNKSKHSFTS